MFDGYGNIKVLGGSTYRFSRGNECSMIALYSRWIIGYSLNNRAMWSASPCSLGAERRGEQLVRAM